MSKKFYIEENEPIPAISFADSAPVGFVEVTDQEVLKQLHTNQYIQRQKDGVDYYNDIRTEEYIEVLNGIHTQAEVILFEIHLNDFRSQLLFGNWLTAQEILSNLALSGMFDQAEKDSIQTYVDNYVTNNY